MNLCIVSTFDCTADDFKSMVKEVKDANPGIVSEHEIAVVNDHRVISMFNVIDMEAFQGVMSSPEMLAWDKANNNVDVIYSLEQVN